MLGLSDFPPPAIGDHLNLKTPHDVWRKKHFISSFLLQIIESFATRCSHTYFEQQQQQQQQQKLPAMLALDKAVMFWTKAQVTKFTAGVCSNTTKAETHWLHFSCHDCIGCGMTALCWSGEVDGRFIGFSWVGGWDPIQILWKLKTVYSGLRWLWNKNRSY